MRNHIRIRSANGHVSVKMKPRQLRPLFFKKKLTILNYIALLSLVSFFVYFIFLKSPGFLDLGFGDDVGPKSFQLKFSSTGQVKTRKCQIPDLPLFSPEIMKYIKNIERINCAGAEKDWVTNNGTFAFVTEDAKREFGKLTCKFIELERDGDFSTKQSGKITIGQYFKFETSDFIRVECTGSGSKAGGGTSTWVSFLVSPRAKLEKTTPPVSIPMRNSAKDKLPLNVLMWGHDSLSRNTFVRKLPKTYKFAKESLNGLILEGYNIVGDGTPQALIPILTGKTESELPETRKSKKSAHYVDVYPFIWKEFKEKGYLTGYMEDQPGLGTFQYRLKGFDDPPTDYYMRPYFIAAQSYMEKYKPYCIGSIPTHKAMMNYVQNIFLQKKEIPKFVFSFHTELSHGDANLIQGADDDLLEFVTELQTSTILNQTILIFMSDHGHRFAHFRETLQGKQEERKPIVMFIFPPWFEKVYPKAYANFKHNTNILSTPFDLHETFVDIKNLPNLPDSHFEFENSLSSRGMSLFRKIPSARTCSDAGIEPHWCACLQWNIISTNDTIVQRGAKEFVNYLNDLTSTHRELCEPLKLGSVLWAAHSYPKDELLHFKGSQDMDGRVPDMSDSTIVQNTVLQVKVETLPGGGHYEASISYDIRNQKFTFKESDISRINKYGNQADCVRTDRRQGLEHLGKYCFCRGNQPMLKT